ncbi:tRNA (adenosine(37)-N6)-threonylcarbamoyltransferase complex dimerization subunit type 1 TsaB [Marinicrinis lubricantis]|uniref:tRNA (Adenosine(37)-N6)-threonylcarbamoyltransferase complex dimerization subunit type 1 TsaB n=1 Tax=Marinicrinis lubricantis TaxID=2086470 RepID=A0ABW1IR90_9BACL
MSNVSDSKILAMDTSTGTMTVCLLEGDQAAASVQIQAIRNHSIQLVPTIQQLLTDTGWSMKQLNAVAVGSGPGSYTGIRIGATVAKTMAWALKLPVIGVSSLAAMAAPFFKEEQKGWVVPLMDGRRGQAYTALYEAAVPEGSETDGIRPVNDWLDYLQERLEQEDRKPAWIRFVGETKLFIDLIQQFQSRITAGTQVWVEESHMDAYYVGLLASKVWSQGKTGEVHSFVPNYTQLAEAEQKLLAKKAQEDS